MTREDTPDALEVLTEAVRRVGADFMQAFKQANSPDADEQTRGLVAMQVLNMRDGEWPLRRGFAPLPSHLPDDEDGMRRLLTSTVSADADLKADLVAWVSGNREYHARAAKALEVAASTWLRADAILSVETCEDAQLGESVTAMVDFILSEWKVNIRMAPTDLEQLRAWCWESIGRFDLTPRWATGEDRSPSMFDPSKYKARRDPGQPHPSMRPFRARMGGDDD